MIDYIGICMYNVGMKLQGQGTSREASREQGRYQETQGDGVWKKREIYISGACKACH